MSPFSLTALTLVRWLGGRGYQLWVWMVLKWRWHERLNSLNFFMVVVVVVLVAANTTL